MFKNGEAIKDEEVVDILETWFNEKVDDVFESNPVDPHCSE